MISAQIFTTALKFAAHAAAKKDVRSYLLGTLFEFKDDTLTLAATDGARLAYTRLQLDAPSLIEDQFIVSTAGVSRRWFPHVGGRRVHGRRWVWPGTKSRIRPST